MSLNRILLIGASGNLGSLILNHLISSPSGFQVIVLSRESSKATFPQDKRLEIRRVGDDYPPDGLQAAFRDADAVISAISMAGMHQQYKFIDAAIAAGVKRYFPTEFGLDDLPDWLVELRPMFRIKHDVRDYLAAKYAEKGQQGLEWTEIVCNVFFEMGVMSGFFQFDWSSRTATLIDGGDAKWVVTTLDTVALAVVRALEKPEVTKNRLLLVQDFRTSQREILDAIEQRTREKWGVRHVQYAPWLEEVKNLVRRGDESALPKLTFATVVPGSRWEDREEFANRLLGLPTKSFDEAMDAALKNVV
ncbi:hypothetical protein A1O1_01249 [Capronia coronata CBS 617.96]|uniref:NmrA-like domain-containing protein n=1 Tax=Capronia coronata CBS 617.96 TaxID=1182541 RepID=W9YUC5_9EURO|nr:uncharacterized protein A1O1_01249 [Capronia coronata CBS 617.96]EXJ96123.1 hypothetical protein A1O1_01249 [Capronia coronata CBS 617.96]